MSVGSARIACCLVLGLAVAAGCTSAGTNAPGTSTAAAGASGPSVWARMGASMKSLFAAAPADQAPEKIPASDPTSLSNQPKADGTLYVTMAEVHEQAGRVDRAAELLTKALEEYPDDPQVMLAFARMLDRQNRPEEAIKMYRRALAVNPGAAMLHNDLALCLARRGRLAEAVEPLRQAVALEPSKTLYRNNLATVLVDLGHEDEALAHLASVHPPEVAHYNLGYLLAKKHEFAAAQRHFSLALERNPAMQPAQQWLQTLAARQSPSRQEPPNSPAPQVAGTPPAAAAVRASSQARSPAGPPMAVPDVHVAFADRSRTQNSPVALRVAAPQSEVPVAAGTQAAVQPEPTTVQPVPAAAGQGPRVVEPDNLLLPERLPGVQGDDYYPPSRF